MLWLLQMLALQPGLQLAARAALEEGEAGAAATSPSLATSPSSAATPLSPVKGGAVRGGAAVAGVAAAAAAAAAATAEEGVAVVESGGKLGPLRVRQRGRDSTPGAAGAAADSTPPKPAGGATGWE